VLAETERLRSALLASVSRPGRRRCRSSAAPGWAESASKLSEADRIQLLQTILGERAAQPLRPEPARHPAGYGALQPTGGPIWGDRGPRYPAAAAGAGNWFTLDLPEALPAIHDPVLIEQVLVNLLDNAAKYSGKDGSIGLSAAVEADVLVVRVDDDGPGIPVEAREAVFDVFYRVHSADEQTAGTGLGLSICRGIVEAHGGDIRLEDGPGNRGTTVAVRLPLSAMPQMGDGEKGDAEAPAE
jgi:two-component system sensor histidine kinase KdpD